MRHEQYMRNKEAEDEEKLMDEYYSNKMTDTNTDMVNSPSHYNQSGIECIAAIQAALGPNFKYYLQGNIMKYLWRFDYKGKPLEDLQKAKRYVEFLIDNFKETI